MDYRTWARPLAFLAGLVTVTMATAEELQAAPTVSYAVPVRLQMAPAAAAATWVHDGKALDSPSNPVATIPIGDHARVAYVLLTRRLFLDGGDAPAATLTVESVAGGLPVDLAGWSARVTHTLSLTSAEGEDLGRWTVTGEAPLAGGASGALPVAFSKAAKQAAAAFERQLETKPAVLAWLQARGASRRTEYPDSTIATDAAGAARRRSYRGERVLFVEVGLGGSADVDQRKSRYAYYIGPGNEVSILGLAGLRVGGSGRDLLWQLSAGSWSRNRSDETDWAERFDVTFYGIDVGAVRRIGEGVEIQGGAGLQAGLLKARNLRGPSNSGTNDADKFKLQPAVFAGFRAPIGLGQGGVLMRLGLEARTTFNNSFTVVSQAGNYHAPSWSVSLLIGLERPFDFRR